LDNQDASEHARRILARSLKSPWPSQGVWASRCPHGARARRMPVRYPDE
jgi:hypothetical protein